MSANQASNQYTMTIGLYLGISFSVVIFAGHLFGVSHFPGDNLSMINMMIFIFGGSYAGRHYRDKLHEGPLNYWQAFGLIVKAGFFASVVYGFFAFFFYRYIATGAIDFFIEQMGQNLKQWGQMTAEQSDAMLQLYRNALNPGSMAFLTWFYQVLASVLFGFIIASLVKTPQRSLLN